MTGRPYIPKGCDQQGRIPQAAADSREGVAGDDQPQRRRSDLVSDWALVGAMAHLAPRLAGIGLFLVFLALVGHCTGV